MTSIGCNTDWALGHPEYSEEMSFLVMEHWGRLNAVTYSLPLEYTQEADAILTHFPKLLEITVTRCVLEGMVPATVTTVDQMVYIIRSCCIVKNMLVCWDEFTEVCIDRMLGMGGGVDLILPWQDASMSDIMVRQAVLVAPAVTAVNEVVKRAWDVFLSLIAATVEETPPISWLTGSELRTVFDSPRLAPDTSISKHLLYHFLRHMQTNDGDDVAAAHSATRSLNNMIRSQFQKPLHDLDIGPVLQTVAVLDHIKEMLGVGCTRFTLLEELCTLNVLRDVQDSNFLGCISRLMRAMPKLQLESIYAQTPKPSLARALRVRGVVMAMFGLAHRTASVPVRDIIQWLSQDSTERTLYATLRTVVQNCLRVMFASFPEYGSSVFPNLASMVASAMLDIYIPLGKGADKRLLDLSKQIVTGCGESRVLDLSVLVEYVCSLPHQKKHAYGLRQTYDTSHMLVRPQTSDAARSSATMTAAFLKETSSTHFTMDTKAYRVMIMTDGLDAVDDVPWVSPSSLMEVFAYHMPTPRMLASQVDQRIRDGLFEEDENVSIVSCAVLWAMARTVRQRMTVIPDTPLQSESCVPALPKKRRKVADSTPALQCMACMDACAAAPSLDCGHPLCYRCAATSLEVRVISLLAGDGSVQEQLHGDLLKCPHPGCGTSIIWGRPHMGGDVRHMLDKLLVAKRVRERCRVAEFVKCYLCFNAAEVGEDMVGTCPTCSHKTCAQCGDKFHPGDVCPTALRGSDVAPADILSRAKWQGCPACNVKTTKNQGCNHMTCTDCGADWCWTCSEQIVGDITEHYSLSGKCSLRGYSKKTETARMHAAVTARTDLTEEQKESALRMLYAMTVQTTDDL